MQKCPLSCNSVSWVAFMRRVVVYKRLNLYVCLHSSQIIWLSGKCNNGYM